MVLAVKCLPSRAMTRRLESILNHSMAYPSGDWKEICRGQSVLREVMQSAAPKAVHLFRAKHWQEECRKDRNKGAERANREIKWAFSWD